MRRIVQPLHQEAHSRSVLIYAFVASAYGLNPALIAGFMRGVSEFMVFMRPLLGLLEAVGTVAAAGLAAPSTA